MSKLLTEQELKEVLYQLWRDGRDNEDRYLAVTNALDIIQQQKKAHGDMVIGVDEKQLDPESVLEPEDSINFERIAWNKMLRAEQRERNK